ncbi:MAG: 2-C-methyl-D-erythritol 4-phosphate cytidylyltransferase [Cyclobacteriaceae bacterium]
MKRYAVIVAGGKGVRMGSQTPKQFLAINGVPIVVHTIKAFLKADPNTMVILVLPKDQKGRWADISNNAGLEDIQVVTGGEKRFNSVKNGLEVIADNEGVVAVHDAVRPCIDPKIINRSFEIAEAQGSAVVCVPPKDSLRRSTKKGSEAVDRSSYFIVQTPQTFRISIIKEAYKRANHSGYTDDASVVEQSGTAVSMVEGDYRNIKVTTAEDLLIAELYLK